MAFGLDSQTLYFDEKDSIAALTAQLIFGATDNGPVILTNELELKAHVKYLRLRFSDF